MMIVIDVGCARYGGDYSVERLIEEFHPDLLYAIDPNLADVPGERLDLGFDAGDTVIFWRKEAAWLYDGEIGFVSAGLTSWLTEMPEKPKVPCFDLARFIGEFSNDQEIVLKMDAEKSEYDLLERLIKTGADKLLKLVWVEWHCVSCGRGAGGHRPDCPDPIDRPLQRQWIEENISCELAEWRW